ncbi:hypothetical protein K4F52_007277 [Lecanicillium sp. MT-2017a]|nr:hypothetical protein K4F52_007277 [Lecanicillium sp. MT-2017a]
MKGEDAGLCVYAFESWSGVWGKLLASVEGLPTRLVGGSYSISARYCEPLVDVPHRRNTLQVLVHGITYTKDYWSGRATRDIGPGSTNSSWVYFAAQQGYPTLAIDRPCNGKSSRPNGLIECQVPLEAAIITAVINKARSGQLPTLPTEFDKIIYVGHSYGSLVGNHITATYPDSIDQIHLTGFTQKVLVGGPSVIIRSVPLPAGLIAPTRFPSLDVSYIIGTSKDGARPCFYEGDYDDVMVDYEWRNRGTVTLGEFATVPLGQLPSPNFKGDVFVVNGDADNIFCASDTVTALAGKPGQCAAFKYSEHVGSSYPVARHFGFHNVLNAGHCVLSHNNGKESTERSHGFMESTGF